MLNTPFALDLAQFEIQERLKGAARAALVAQLPAAPSRMVTARLQLAASLRGFAIRLDPSLACEPSLAMPYTSRRVPWKSF